MKILLIVSSYAPNTGGLQTVTRQLAGELSARGHLVGVITNRYPRTLPANEVLDGIEVTRWHFLAPRLQQLLNLRFDLLLAGLVYFPLTLARLVLRLRREQPDVVNLHFVGAPSIFVLLARWFTRFRLVVSTHGDDVEGWSSRPRLDRWVFRALLSRAEVVTACSRYLLKKAITLVPASETKGRAIHNSIELQPKSCGQTTTHRIVAAGRLYPAKGFDVLLKAIARSDNKPELTLIGDGPERENLEKLARSLGLNGEIRFKGNQDHDSVLREMASAGLIAIPSRSESFGIVALEGMALGKPIVATRVGGLSEVLEGADALLVQPDNAAELSTALETVIARLQTEPEFGSRNRKCAARYSVEQMANGYLEAFRG